MFYILKTYMDARNFGQLEILDRKTKQQLQETSKFYDFLVVCHGKL